jgi:membrane protease YdiL (CAAX protease family)
MFTGITGLVKQHQVLAFAALTFPLSWWPWALMAFYPDQVPLPLFPWGPGLAALIVVAIADGRAGVRELLSRIVRWKVSWVWYAAALILPVFLVIVAASLNILLGTNSLNTDHLANWPEVFFTFAFVFVVIALGEEPGFRGFALSRLQSSRTALQAALIVSVIGVIWHVPLFLIGDSPWSNIIIIVAGYILFTWLFNNTRGSVLIAMLLHTSLGVIGPELIGPMFTGADLTRYSWLLTGGFAIAALVVVVVFGPRTLTRKSTGLHDAIGGVVGRETAPGGSSPNPIPRVP